jgi:hypothetical protein
LVPFVTDCAGEICGLVLEINCLTFSIDWGVAGPDIDVLDLDKDLTKVTLRQEQNNKQNIKCN